ncbi:DUF3592 domain-containing protein [Spirosoma sp.]|uniref:DUF3592 domain-containing protein n=1 Tax=Spirosoma sp. TaxID=1899569 RepID=UPI002631012D|nr:DUF3592 domain-containing protein [Spirosoma sp.]MCX6213668.1 hypothetical protein [Spirosoma sp.]
MKVLIPLLLGGLFYSLFSGLFLLSYYRLVSRAYKATGMITGFDRSEFFLLRKLFVSLVRFKTRHNTWIERQPDHSVSHELNAFVRQGEVRVYYQEDRPETFVIESGLEVFVNWLVIILTLAGIVWLFCQ